MGIEAVLLLCILASAANNFFVYCCFAYIPFHDDDDDDDDEEEEMIRGGEVRGLKAKELKKIMEFTHKDRVWGETECTICLEKIETGERCRFLQGCGHVFHKVCADKWLRRKATCPICRAVVVPVSISIEQIM